MELNILSKLVFEKYEHGTLSYTMLKPDLLSGTGYKVLQGQELAGFARCVRVMVNGRDKLSYRTEGLTPLTHMLHAMQPNEFCVVVAGIFHAFQCAQQVGFLNTANIVCYANRIFVEPGSFAVRLIYLPLSGASPFGAESFPAIKSMIARIIAENAHLNNETVRQLGMLLRDANASLERLYACVGSFGRSAAPQANSITAVNGTEEMGNTVGLVSGNSAGLPSGDVVSGTGPTKRVKPPKKEKPVARVGAGQRRAKSKPESDRRFEIETEVLDDLFVPTLVLESVDTPKKLELLINKQNYIIGKKAESVNGVIGFSNAVSRVHCRISHNDGKNFITDLGSANGSFLNGKKLDPEVPATIDEGDKIKIADITFVVKAI